MYLLPIHFEFSFYNKTQSNIIWISQFTNEKFENINGRKSSMKFEIIYLQDLFYFIVVRLAADISTNEMQK